MASNYSENVARAWCMNLLIFSLVFGMAGSVNSHAHKKQLMNKGACISGIFLQFVISPMIGFMLVKFLNLDFYTGIPVIALTSSPGGIFSNWCSSVFNADLSLSVTMTLLSTIMACIMLPCNLIFYTAALYGNESIDLIDWMGLFITIIVVMAALVSGLLCSFKLKSTQFNLFANRMGNLSGVSLFVLFAFFMTYIDYADDAKISVWNQPWQFYIGLTAPCLISVLLGITFSALFELPKPERISVVYECCCPNGAIAISLIFGMFLEDDQGKALVVPIYFTMVQSVVLITIFVYSWKNGWTKAPKNEGLCEILGGEYEIWENDEASQARKQQEEEEEKKRNAGNDQFLKDSFDNGIDFFEDDKWHNKGRKIFSFRNKAKIMDSEKAPKLSSQSTLSPESFQQTRKIRSYKNGRNSGRKSKSVAARMLAIETIQEDPLDEDPDISIAGESDLESGLSVSQHDDGASSLFAFSFSRPMSGGSNMFNRPAVPKKSEGEEKRRLPLPDKKTSTPTKIEVSIPDEAGNSNDVTANPDNGDTSPPITSNAEGRSASELSQVNSKPVVNTVETSTIDAQYDTEGREKEAMDKDSEIKPPSATSTSVSVNKENDISFSTIETASVTLADNDSKENKYKSDEAGSTADKTLLKQGEEIMMEIAL
jgi:predicted Na+-dependent transporter